jgi:hypothetical protein
MRTASQGRLLFVCPNLEPGGAERQWAALAPGLAERGFDVKVLTLDGRGGLFDELRGQGITVHCAGLRSRADPIGLARALRLAGSRTCSPEGNARRTSSRSTSGRTRSGCAHSSRIRGSCFGPSGRAQPRSWPSPTARGHI